VKVKTHGIDVELSASDQAVFLLGGAAGFIADAYLLFGVTGGECAATGASIALGAKRFFDSCFRDTGKTRALLMKCENLIEFLQKEGREDLARALDRHIRLCERGFLNPDELDRIVQETIGQLTEDDAMKKI